MGDINRVAIIGGGVSGLTTALLLRIAGFETVLFVRGDVLRPAEARRDPSFASVHAAASILPHSVQSPHVVRWTAISQEFFGVLAFIAVAGVRTQTHFEIFEHAVEPPPYADELEDFEYLSDADIQLGSVPRRRRASVCWGWRFRSFFCDGPEYLRYLFHLYDALGGRREQVDLGEGDLTVFLKRDFQTLVNCTGLGARELLSCTEDALFTDRFESVCPADSPVPLEHLQDQVQPKLIRGFYVLADIKEIVPSQDGLPFSYNYMPSADVYRTLSGAPADVYCYPRADRWVLGGSRQVATSDGAGGWNWESTIGPVHHVRQGGQETGDLPIPAPILELNSALLSDMSFGALDLMARIERNPEIVSAGVGYRFVRDSPTDSVRLTTSCVADSAPRHDVLKTRYIVHNYGHGGSGFTLSWGCALDVLGIIRSLDGPLVVEPQATSKCLTSGYAAAEALLRNLTERLSNVSS